jgi:hypothetical protein
MKKLKYDKFRPAPCSEAVCFLDLLHHTAYIGDKQQQIVLLVRYVGASRV